MDVNIYIATSIKGVRKQNGMVGIVLEAITAKGPATVTGFETVKGVSANEAEVIALAKAIERIKKGTLVTIHTDNNYLQRAFSLGWTRKWRENGYQTVKGEDIVAKDKWKSVLQNLEGTQPHIVVGEPNEYRQWLQNEVIRRQREPLNLHNEKNDK
jgi:ribonuclease HI